MPIKGMDHFTVLTADLNKTLEFYTALLDLTAGPRPAFADRGAWLYADNHPVLHVMADAKMPAETAGVLDHMAFRVTDLPATAARLKAAGIKFLLKRQVPTHTWQIFCHDPSGAKVELDFSPDEPPPAGVPDFKYPTTLEVAP